MNSGQWMKSTWPDTGPFCSLELSSQSERVWLFICFLYFYHSNPYVTTWNLKRLVSDLFLTFCLSIELQNRPRWAQRQEKTGFVLDPSTSLKHTRDWIQYLICTELKETKLYSRQRRVASAKLKGAGKHRRLSADLRTCAGPQCALSFPVDAPLLDRFFLNFPLKGLFFIRKVTKR